MKKVIIYPVIILSLLAAIVLAAAALISPVSKRYIIKHSKELTGRQIGIDRLRINIFTGTLRMNGFSIAEADDSTRFASLGELDVRMSLPKLLSHKIIINRIFLDSLCVDVMQDGEVFNFSDLLARFGSSDTVSTQNAAESTPWDLGLYDISLQGSTLRYRDRAVGAEFTFKDMSLFIPGVYFSGKSTDVGLNLNLSEGGSIGMNLQYDMQQGEYNLGVKVDGLRMEDFLPYIRRSFDISSLSGRIGADMNIGGNLDHILEFSASGAIFASGVNIKDRDRELLAGADSLYVGIRDVDIVNRKLNISKIYADKIATRLILNADSTNNFSYLLSSQPETASQDTAAGTEQGMTLHVDDFQISGGSVYLCDRMNVEQGFEYTLRDINISCKDFAPDKNNVVSLSSRLNNKGMVRIRWAGAMDNLNDQNLIVMMSNVDIKDFTPYSEKYLAYPLKSGTLSFKSQNVIKNRHLNGTNTLDLYGCEVDKKRKDIKAEYNIPLRAGVYVLKDKTGHINLDLPVSGSIDSPSFSYRKIILKTLTNVFVKVATAPFDFLGGHDKQIDRIPLDPMKMMFSSENYAKLDDIARILHEKPGMSVNMEQRIRFDESVGNIALRHLKRDFYTYSNPGRQNDGLELIDIAQIDEINTKSPQFKSFADSVAAANNISYKKNDYIAVATALYGEKATAELTKGMEMRNAAVCKYMREQHGISDSLLLVCSLSDQQLRQYTGKDMYKININIAGETLGGDTVSVSIPAMPETATVPENTADSADGQ